MASSRNVTPETGGGAIRVCSLRSAPEKCSGINGSLSTIAGSRAPSKWNKVVSPWPAMPARCPASSNTDRVASERFAT